MNKSQIKNFQIALGNFTPLISSLENKETIFVDSDITGRCDKNRNVIIINKRNVNDNDLLIKLSGFDSFEGNLFKGKVYLDDGISNIIISEPIYTLGNVKSKFIASELKSYVQETWLQALNEYKSSSISKSQSTKGFKINKNIFDKKILLGGLVTCGLVLLMGGGYIIGSNKEQSANNTFNQQPYQSNGNEVDGKTLALQNLGLDPNAMEFDNSCFTEK
ncbi:hypothetical protein [Acinetobacter gandensis]|uniref:hypothetical protein n=1 Tax=Acinetobacter gandensis TaxID=1443941 RepID=UPI0039895BE2